LIAVNSQLEDAMRRFKLFVVGALVLGALVPAVALAASSPTVETGPVTNVTTGSAVLTGTVNPNGAATGYSFSYGTTTALGTTTPAKRAGRGDKSVAVKQSITGLIPGTTYYYQLGALSTKGGTTGQVRTFKTGGPPPPGAVTGAATAVGSTTATVTGTIDTNGATTSWNVQYGTTTSYGVNTTAQAVANSAAPVPVSAALSGLAPLTLFHYRIVAYHSGTSIGAGADGTFFTEPTKPLAPNLRTKTTPPQDKKSPYAFTTYGSLRGNAVVPPTLRCVGNATVNYYSGKIRTAHVLAPVQPNCTFAAHVSFRRSHGKHVVPITVKIHYLGNGYLAGTKKVNHVKVGRK
jgi:phosphodiesterase/alkaline phosphatase D-like protein